MTQREKTVAGALGGVLALWGAYRFAVAYVIEPRRALLQEIRDQKKHEEELDLRLLSAVNRKKLWQDQAARTLGGTQLEAQTRFRTDVSRLIAKNRLERGFSINPRQPAVVTKGLNKGFVELPVLIHAEGKLENLRDFLHDFYELPYAAAVTKLSINPVGGESATTGKSGRGKREREGGGANASGPDLNLTIDAAALQLPKIDGVQSATYDPENPPEPPKRLRHDDAAEYAKITEDNLFRVYEPPPPPVVVKGPDKAPETQPAPVHREPPPPRDPRPDADKLVLIATISKDGQPAAYVKHEGRLTEPPKVYKLNEAIDDNGDGKLVLVHTKGIVVRVAKGREPAKFYFYALGTKFNQREELDPGKHPDVQRQLELVLSRG